MARKARDGSGTIYKELDPKRKTKWRGEKTIVLPDGARKRITVRGVTQADVRWRLAERERELRSTHPDALTLTLSEFLALWLRQKKTSLKSSTYRTYEHSLRKHIVPALGERRLVDVRPIDFQVVFNRIAVTSPAAAMNTRRIIRGALNHAARLELIPRNPVTLTEKPKTPPPARGMWQPHEVRCFLRAAYEHSRYADVFFLAIATGMRVGEILALRFSDVDGNVIHVRRSLVQHNTTESTPKTASSVRSITVSDEVRRMLEARYERFGDGLVFRSPRANREHLHHSLPNSELKRIAVLAGVPVIRFHDLRRVAATYWAKAGLSLKGVQARLGHTTSQMSVDVYMSTLDEDERVALVGLRDLTGEEWG